jgi:thiamine biosynthesis lipoprotein
MFKLVVTACAGRKPGCWCQEERELYYGIPVQFRFYPADEKLAKQVWTYLESIDGVFNDYKAISEVSALNSRTAPGEVTLSPMLAEAFAKSQKAFQLSGGVFDITCAPIRNLWKEAAQKEVQPSEKEIAAVLEKCGLKHVELNDNRLKILKNGIQFDFGGIIKGIMADHVVEMLKAAGVKRALVQIGGETAAFGLSPRDKPFRIAIQHPEDREGAWSVIQDPGNGISASTSGNYENPIIINGEAFYHIMDPRVGYPAKTQIVSVSIAFPETGKNWLADTLSTTGVILGPEKTFEILKPLGGEAMFLIKQNGEIREVISEGWRQFK